MRNNFKFRTEFHHHLIKDSVYTPADVFEKVVVDLRKRFHLFAKLRDSLKK